MNHKKIKRSVSCFAIMFFIVSALSTAGCAPKQVKVVYKQEGNSEHSEVDHKDKKKKGPPAHAPAHGYRAKHQYRYYPSCSVYYDTGRRVYFYMKGDKWEVGVSLPRSLHMSLDDYVGMELDTDKPYIFHADHVKKFPPGKMKKKDKKKGKWG
jgi:hypothetical protein